MKIEFATNKLAKCLCSEKEMRKAHGAIRAKKLMVRLKVLESSCNAAEIPKTPPDRCHQLQGKYKGHFAVDLDHPFRLIFIPKDPVPLLADGGIDLKKVTSIVIISVEDYHD